MRLPKRARSVQFRVAASAAGVVLVVLAVAGFGAVRWFEQRLVEQIDDELAADAVVLRRAIDAGAVTTIRRSGVANGLVVQVVGPSGRVVGGNDDGEALDALVDVRPVDVAVDAQTVETAGGQLRVVVEPLRERPAALLVARPVDQIVDAVTSLRRLMLMGVPLATALFAAIAWVVVGRSLRPVEQVRSTVAAITERDLSQRVDVPASGDEIARLATTMNEMLDRVQVGVDRELRFVADASHELRSPLAGARALLETETSDPDEVAATRADALSTLARIEAIVEQLLSGGAADHAERVAAMRPVDLDELVLAQVRRLQRTTGLRVDGSAVSGGQVQGHEDDLGRLVENLAANAARHAESVVRLAVSQASTGAVTFVVEDDGDGVPVREREAIFGRFTRLDSARARDAGGAGLGLAIVASIVDRHGARIEVGDSDLGGAAFRVTFPPAS